MAAALQKLCNRQSFPIAAAQTHAHGPIECAGGENHRMRGEFFLEDAMDHGVRVADGRFHHGHGIRKRLEMRLCVFKADRVFHFAPRSNDLQQRVIHQRL